MVVLAAVRREHNTNSLSALERIPGSAYLGDAPTKDSPFIAKKLGDGLVSGKRVHDCSSYIALSDVPLPTRWHFPTEMKLLNF